MKASQLIQTPFLLGAVDAANLLGEGCLWDVRLDRVLWSDIQSARLHTCRGDGRDPVYVELPDRLGSFALTRNPDVILGAFASGFALFNWVKRRYVPLPNSPILEPGLRFNDGRVDTAGRFWAGTMVEKGKAGRASLYYVAPDGEVKRAIDGLSISNGLCWSESGDAMYLADSPARQIYKFDYDPDTGTAQNKTTLVETPEGVYPDGAVVDGQGRLWSAEWDGASLAVYDPNGLVQRLTMPVTRPTCMAFGGPQMNRLFVTSAREGLSDEQLEKEPLAGSLLIFETSVSGVEPCLWQGNVSHMG